MTKGYYDHRVAKAMAVTSILVSIMTACSPAPRDNAPQRTVSERDFSQDDRRAARALSLAKNTATVEGRDPFEKAMLCSLAIESLAERFKSGKSMNPALLKALDQAGQIYVQRAEQAGRASGPGTREWKAQMKRLGGTLANFGDRARMALSCLQNLQ